MPSLTNFDSVYLLIAFFVPGFIISLTRSQFLTGNERGGAEQFLRYLTYSSLNYGLWSWLIFNLSSDSIGIETKTFIWFFIIFIAPAVLGTLLGLSAQRGWMSKILSRFRVHTTHPVPSAWDWRFHNTPDCWVMVTLKNKLKWSGYMGSGSFASSDPIQRDIYIQQVFDVDDKNMWIPKGSGVLINAGEISTIEFWPVNPPTENANG